MSAPTTTRKRGWDFSTEEIEHALLALALVGGNRVRARALLKHDDTMQRTPSEAILDVWKHKYAQRYDELRTLHAPEIERGAIHTYREIVVLGAEAIRDGVQKTHDGMNDLDAKDAAAATKNLAIVSGVAVDKLMLFTDRPTVRIERADIDHDLALLAQRAGLVFDGTADDITDADPGDDATRDVVRDGANGAQWQSQTRELPAGEPS